MDDNTVDLPRQTVGDYFRQQADKDARVAELEAEVAALKAFIEGMVTGIKYVDNVEERLKPAERLKEID